MPMGDHAEGVRACILPLATVGLLFDQGIAAMGIPYLSRHRRVVRQPRTPTAIYFTMEDLADMQHYATMLARYGVTWRLDAMDPLRPEIAIIYRNCVPNFELWRSTDGLLLRCLESKKDVGVLEMPDQNRAWSLCCWLMTPPVWFEDEREVTARQGVVDRLLKWISKLKGVT
jgi:hypothetical protein